jgi:hypothetical protein
MAGARWSWSAAGNHPPLQGEGGERSEPGGAELAEYGPTRRCAATLPPQGKVSFIARRVPAS